MRVRLLPPPIVMVLAGLLLFGISGCGGGGNPPPPPTTSRIHVTVQWADHSRSVAAPGSALSATVTLAGAKVNGGDETFTVNRNDNLAAHAETYDSPEDAYTGSHTLRVNFYAQPGAAGSLVATAVASVTVNTSGDIPNAVTNVQTAIKSVSVTPNQQVNVGQDAFLTFTAKDVGGNIVAVTDGSARFAATDGVDKLAVSGIVGTGLAAGVASVTATVDGVTSSATPVNVLAPVAIAYVASGQNAQAIAFLQLLQAKHITPIRFDGIPSPSTLQAFDVVMLDESGSLSTDDAAKVQTFLSLGRGVVLLGRTPAILAGSGPLDQPNSGGENNLSPIAPWFGGVVAMRHYNLDVSARTGSGLVILPPGASAGVKVYSPGPQDDMPVVVTGDITSPLTDRVALGSDYFSGDFTAAAALAYELPGDQGSGRVYWQFHPYGLNSAYTNQVLALLIAGTDWAARR